MTDDHGCWANGCYGCSEIHTPHLDALAEQGVLLKNAYTPSPVCSPARASFWTGKLPSQHGIHDYLQESETGDRDWLRDQVNLGELLQAHGYRTGLVGKWHCGNSSRAAPGFDHWLGYDIGKFPHTGWNDFLSNGVRYQFDGSQAEFLTEQGIRFLDGISEKQPFFLFMGYVNTHSPFSDQLERWTDYYRDVLFQSIVEEAPSIVDDGWVRFGIPEDPVEHREWLIQYYAAVSTIDEQVGRMIQHLKASGMWENTIVVYTSDHGHMNGQHGLYTKGNATVPQNFYDESIRVPCIISGGAVETSDGVIESCFDHCDLFSTLAEAGGVEKQALDRLELPGKSFYQTFTGGAIESGTGFQFCEYGNARMISNGVFKLIERYAPHDSVYGDEFYDLDHDPRERNNLIAEERYASRIACLRQLLKDHFSKWEEPDVSGANILEQPKFNDCEPWRLERPEEIPTYGSDINALRPRILEC